MKHLHVYFLIFPLHNCMCLCVCMCVYKCVYVCMYTCVYVYVYMRVCVYLHVCVCPHVCLCVCGPESYIKCLPQLHSTLILDFLFYYFMFIGGLPSRVSVHHMCAVPTGPGRRCGNLYYCCYKWL